MTTIQKAPATKLTLTAIAGSRARPNRTSVAAVPSDPNATTRSTPNLTFSQPSANEPPIAPALIAPSSVPYSAGPCAIWLCATRGSNAQYALANGKNASDRISVAPKGRLFTAWRRPVRYGAEKPLRWQALRVFPRLAPPQQGRDRSDVAGAKNPEWGGDSQSCDRKAAEGGSHRAADVVTDVIGGDGSIQILPRHKARRDRQPCRSSQ